MINAFWQCIFIGRQPEFADIRKPRVNLNSTNIDLFRKRNLGISTFFEINILKPTLPLPLTFIIGLDIIDSRMSYFCHNHV